MEDKPQNKKISWYWGIWLGFVILILFLYKGLHLNPYQMPSKLIDKPFPAFELKSVFDANLISENDIVGQPSIVHVWATWCGICLQEHKTLLDIKQKWQPTIYSVSYKDQPNKVISLLNKLGDPYDKHINDNIGKLALDLGLTGTPETYVLDEKGIIRYRHVGPLDIKTFENSILPLLG